jgi:hypothetical protein
MSDTGTFRSVAILARMAGIERPSSTGDGGLSCTVRSSGCRSVKVGGEPR